MTHFIEPVLRRLYKKLHPVVTSEPEFYLFGMRFYFLFFFLLVFHHLATILGTASVSFEQ